MKLLSELNFPQKKACKLFCNKKAGSISENSVQHDRTKHVELDTLHKGETWETDYKSSLCKIERSTS